MLSYYKGAPRAHRYLQSCSTCLAISVAALGWPSERVVVIDCDLGRSGASTHDREGFQKLLADVSEGRVGIVLTLDVSRLSRNCRDWHHLLEACARNDTLILVQGDVCDPARIDDRILLGITWLMSDTEAPGQCLSGHLNNTL